ncbi:MAG: AIR synthase-related protein [Anaerolineae bacterium]
MAPEQADREEHGITYAESGVDYESIDPAKVLAQRAAASTADQLLPHGFNEVSASRGESAYAWEEPDAYRVLVVECLGTKSLVADATREVTGQTYYDAIAQDTVAMIVNDVVAIGAAPVVVNAYWAIGDSAWFEDRQRAADLVRGWADACEASGAAWGGGETPALSGIVAPDAIDLAGGCVGIVKPKVRLTLGDRLGPGDAVVLLASSGIHANGLSLARRIADELPDGYATDIGDGTMFGEALLVPTQLYPRTVAGLFDAGIDVHYMSNLTGHGWRKLMRANADLTYVMEMVPPVTPLFAFLVEHGGLTDEEAYGTLNMGAGFAVYVSEEEAPVVVEVAAKHGIEAWVAGRVEAGLRSVRINPLGVAYEGESLDVRG